MLNMRSATNVSDATSFSNKMRNRRFKIFENLAEQLPRPLRIIDIGGTAQFWEHVGFAGRNDVSIVAVNLSSGKSEFDNIDIVKGNACNLEEFSNGEFDIAFSNSVIEHLFTFDKQEEMAAEVQRVAKAYWVQTPQWSHISIC